MGDHDEQTLRFIEHEYTNDCCADRDEFGECEHGQTFWPLTNRTRCWMVAYLMDLAESVIEGDPDSDHALGREFFPEFTQEQPDIWWLGVSEHIKQLVRDIAAHPTAQAKSIAQEAAVWIVTQYLEEQISLDEGDTSSFDKFLFEPGLPSHPDDYMFDEVFDAYADSPVGAAFSTEPPEWLPGRYLRPSGWFTSTSHEEDLGG